jgi:nitrite reductase/ring-hydroxylating ferredoxin subunit
MNEVMSQDGVAQDGVAQDGVAQDGVAWHALVGVDPATAVFPLETEIAGQPILVFKTAKGFAATEPLCPHQKVPLTTAVLMNGDTMIRCSRHNFIFRLDSGAGVNCSGMRLKTYPIREAGGGLECGLPAAAA